MTLPVEQDGKTDESVSERAFEKSRQAGRQADRKLMSGRISGNRQAVETIEHRESCSSSRN